MDEIMARTLSFGVSGVNGYPVHVEVFGISGIPGMEIIGLPDASVRESRDRVNAAIINSGKQMQPKRITINLAPADMKKEGPSFDLPIAVGVLIATGEILPDPELNIDTIALFGELSLDGLVQPIAGALPMVISAKENGIRDVILPEKNAKEVACIEGMNIMPISHLRQVIGYFEGRKAIQKQQQISYESLKNEISAGATDMALIKGQKGARRALEVAAAGGHNMIMIGVPGSGKTMLARCLPGILPPMSFEEALETTRIHSISGKLPPNSGLMVVRPFCAPHHNASVASLIGGGQEAKPGEVSLAHNGVLFLDELPEFSRSAMEALRQPLEDGIVSVSRVRKQALYQSSFMLVAAMNPCPCGYYGSTRRVCRCTPQETRRYLVVFCIYACPKSIFVPRGFYFFNQILSFARYLSQEKTHQLKFLHVFVPRSSRRKRFCTIFIPREGGFCTIFILRNLYLSQENEFFCKILVPRRNKNIRFARTYPRKSR